jgi:hypothetical protein
MARRKTLAWALLAAIGACSESSDENALPRQTKIDEVAIPISVKVPSCAGSQSILPISGECDTGLPALYRDMDATAPLAFAKCVWKTFEAQVNQTEALRFRVQDCAFDPEGKPVAISAKNGSLSISKEKDGRVEQARFLQTYDLHGADAMAFLENRRAALAQEERDRCIIRPYQATDFTNEKRWANLYEIAPNAAYMREIEARDGNASACGEEGWSNTGAQFWELRDGEAWFWDIDQEAPMYDPRSFTVLHKHGEGSWSLADMKPVGLAN